MRAPPSLAACFHMHVFCLGSSSSSSCCDAPLAEVRGHRPSPSTLCAELGASVTGGRRSPRLPHCLLGRRCPGCNQASSRCSRAVSDSASNRSPALQEMGPLPRNSRLSALLLRNQSALSTEGNMQRPDSLLKMSQVSAQTLQRFGPNSGHGLCCCQGNRLSPAVRSRAVVSHLGRPSPPRSRLSPSVLVRGRAPTGSLPAA